MASFAFWRRDQLSGLQCRLPADRSDFGHVFSSAGVAILFLDSSFEFGRRVQISTYGGGVDCIVFVDCFVSAMSCAFGRHVPCLVVKLRLQLR